MATFSRTIRIHGLTRPNFSTIVSPDSKTPLSSHRKSRAILSLLKSEQNPGKILDICRAASLTPDSHLDRIAFSAAVSKLARTNNFSYVRQLLDELRASRLDLRNERFAAHSIVLFGEANMVDDAIRTFQEYTEQNGGSVKALNALMFACVLAKKYGEVRRVFVEFPRMYNIERNLDTYNTMIKASCESGSSSSVYSVLTEMDRHGVKPNKTTFSLFLGGLYKEEKFEDVGKVLEMMKEQYGIHPGISIYNVRIQSLCKLKRSREAKALLDGMALTGMKPNVFTYSHLIHGFCREGDLEEAKRLFASMGRNRLEPEADCYYTLVYYLCQGGDFETALSVCKESMEKRWVPNFGIMKSLIEGLSSVGKVEEAKELVAKMKEKFPNRAEVWDEVEAGLPQ